MLPKQQSKADLTEKQKVVEDKTFCLKNKNKSKYVQSLKQSVQPKPDATKINDQKKKEEEQAREKELNELLKVAIRQPKVPVGVDPKSILCEHFKLGQCAKGFKCKFSHDLNVQRKGEKIDIYSDKRDQEDRKETMEDWDQETLEKVVESKSNEYNKNKSTDIDALMDKTMMQFQLELLEIEIEAENLLLARHELVEIDRVRNGNREALTALRKRARTTKTSVPLPFEPIMRDIESRPLIKEVCATCGDHNSRENTWFMFLGTDVFATMPFHAAHSILEKDQARVDYESKKLQSYVKEKSFLISEKGVLSDKISPGVLRSLVTLSDKPKIVDKD